MRRAQLSRVPEPSPSTRRPSASVLRTSTVLPSALVRMSPGLKRAPARHVLGHRDDAETANRRAQRATARPWRTDHGRAARHVVLHLVHVVGRLDRDAAGVERDALADETEHDARRSLRRLVPQHDNTRRLLALPRATPSSIPILEPGDRLLVENLDSEPGGRRDAPRRAPQNRRASAGCPARWPARARGSSTRRACGRARAPRPARSTSRRRATATRSSHDRLGVCRLVRRASKLASVDALGEHLDDASGGRMRGTCATRRDARKPPLPRGKSARSSQSAQTRSLVNAARTPAPTSSTRGHATPRPADDRQLLEGPAPELAAGRRATHAPHARRRARSSPSGVLSKTGTIEQVGVRSRVGHRREGQGRRLVDVSHRCEGSDSPCSAQAQPP